MNSNPNRINFFFSLTEMEDLFTKYICLNSFLIHHFEIEFKEAADDNWNVATEGF